jgi:hypothetical protein
MYGSYGMYSGNKCNFSSSSNLYKPAGVVNISSGYRKLNETNGVMTSLPNDIRTTSVVMAVATPESSFTQLTNVLPGARHIDYQQNPAPVILSVRQNGSKNDGTVGVYTDINDDTDPISYSVGTYSLQYVANPSVNVLINPQPMTVPPTIIYPYQNLVKK